MSFLFKKSTKKVTRLFFSTDVHGSERTYRKFINAGKFYQANVLIMGGDISGKLLIPIIKDKNGNFRATLQGTTEHYATEADLERSVGTPGELWVFTTRLWKRMSSRHCRRNPQRLINCSTS